MGFSISANMAGIYIDAVIVIVEVSKKSYFWQLYFETGQNMFLPETTEDLDEMFKFAFYKPFRLTTQIKRGILSIMKPKYPGFAEG